MENNIKTYFTEKAPAPAGHYSQAIEHNGTLYIAGQLAIDQHGNKYVDASISEQTSIIFKNIELILEAAGSSVQKLLLVTVYITSIEHWAEVNKIYSEVLKNHKPARAIVPVKELHHGLKIEIQAIAAKYLYWPSPNG